MSAVLGDCPFRSIAVRLGDERQSTATRRRVAMSAQSDPTAVAVARAHVEAWSNHDYDKARASLAPDVHVLAVSVDPGAPRADLSGIDAYMEGLVQFGQIVVPGTAR